MISAQAPDPAPSARTLLRVVVVAVVVILGILAGCPDIVLPSHPTAELGITTDGEMTILDVTPGSSAARAGIVAGDRIDIPATPFASRKSLNSGSPNSVRDGALVPLVIVHGGRSRSVALLGTTVPRSFADNATDVFLVIGEVALAVISAILVLLRPSRMTWAFFLFGNAVYGLAVTNSANLDPSLVAALQAVISTYDLPWLWLALFALRFPNDDPTGWRRSAERILLLSLPIFIPLNVWVQSGYLFGVLPPPWLFGLFAFLGVAGLLFAALTFVLTYTNSTVSDRARIRWVMLGFVVGFGGNLTYIVGTTLPGLAVAWPIWLLNLAQTSQIFVAVTVAYAIIRHRVFDVRFFIGRAVVYGILTTGVVATLALIDFAASKVLSGTGLATIGEAGLAVIVGLSLNGLHKRIETLVDTTLFRSRIHAERRLRRVSRGLGHATTLEAIAGIVVHEPVTALHLSSAAIFNRDERGDYIRDVAVGWESAILIAVDRDDPLVLQLLASDEPVPMSDYTLAPGMLPSATLKPSFAMPMRVRANLEAIVFYGPHESQEEIDPQEIETLEHLLAAASSAYDHVRAEISQRKLAELEATLQGRPLGGYAVAATGLP